MPYFYDILIVTRHYKKSWFNVRRRIIVTMSLLWLLVGMNRLLFPASWLFSLLHSFGCFYPPYASHTWKVTFRNSRSFSISFLLSFSVISTAPLRSNGEFWMTYQPPPATNIIINVYLRCHVFSKMMIKANLIFFPVRCIDIDKLEWNVL